LLSRSKRTTRIQMNLRLRVEHLENCFGSDTVKNNANPR